MKKYRLFVSDTIGDNVMYFDASEFTQMITLFTEMCKEPDQFHRITCGVITDQEIYFTFADSDRIRTMMAAKRFDPQMPGGFRQ